MQGVMRLILLEFVLDEPGSVQDVEQFSGCEVTELQEMPERAVRLGGF
jgi:hypothetical protein